MSRNKVTVSVSLDVPEDLLVYDIGLGAFVCKGCGKRQEWDPDAPVKRDGGPSPEARIKQFAGAHAQCVAARAQKDRDEKVRDAALSPCRMDYRDANGGGPHECDKPQGHSGPCGS